MDKKFLQLSFLQIAGVLVYVGLVATFMQKAESLFGSINGRLGFIAFLMLFIVSAVITSFLVLGYPLYLFLSGDKRSGIKMFLYNLSWLVISTICIFVWLFLR